MEVKKKVIRHGELCCGCCCVADKKKILSKINEQRVE